MTAHLPYLDGIPDGYYALLDPAPRDGGTAALTYWHRRRTTRTDGIRAWPATASYGPRMPRRSDIPAEPAARDAFLARWRAASLAYGDMIVTALTADPTAAAQRFSQWRTACCRCARPLKDDASKVYGIDPDCREEMAPEDLARFTRDVARAHAEHEEAQR